MTGDEALALCEGELRRQSADEGYDHAHDDAHVDGEILAAASAYLWHGTERAAPMAGGAPLGWPWADAWKPRDRLSNLVRSGGLCLAERMRLERRGKPHGHVDHELGVVIREMVALAA